MPRAFLFTHKRYPHLEDDPSHSDKDSTCDEFYNLTKLAEVSLAAEKLPQKEIRPVRKEYGCPECGKLYSTSSNLARHKQTHRSLSDVKAKTCPECGKTYVSVPAFSMHLRTHSQLCRCHLCGKAFSRPWLLQGHIRTHTGEKPYRCERCGKGFADKSNLRAHVQTHSDQKPYRCLRCGKAFALRSYLYKHEESACAGGRPPQLHHQPVQAPLRIVLQTTS